MSRIYLSDIHAEWPFARQEAELDAKLPGWRDGAVYRDVVKRMGRKHKAVSALTDRAVMLQPTRRRTGETVTVAALPVLAWTARDMLDVLAALAARRATLASLNCGTTVPPDATPAQIQAAIEAFERAYRRKGDAHKSGGQVSGERRAAAAKAACEAMRPYWGLPSAEYPTKDLLARHGVSRPTAIAYLGPRLEAQRAHEKSLGTSQRNRARRRTDDNDAQPPDHPHRRGGHMPGRGDLSVTAACPASRHHPPHDEHAGHCPARHR